jgi:acetoin utilization deacetylase AcuC-like enzyme
MKIAFDPRYRLNLPREHRFPMEKYELLPQQLLHEGTIAESDLFQPEMVSDEIILLTHDAEYLNRLNALSLSRKEMRAIGFPLSEALIEREKLITSGTLQCVDFAFRDGLSMNIAGGTHHAFTNRGEGFCILNDQAIAANELLDSGRSERILIVDLDVHQGNGTAEIFKHEPRVFTFSMHGEKNYPARKEKSNLDVELPDGTGDKIYLEKLDFHLKKLLDEVQPDFLFYQCGVDILESDKLGRLSLSLEACRERDRLVLDLAKRNDIPLVASMGGGYSKDIRVIIEAHSNTYRLAKEMYF